MRHAVLPSTQPQRYAPPRESANPPTPSSPYRPFHIKQEGIPIQTYSELFSPVAIGGRTLKNRVVMPPMVVFGITGEDGIVPDAAVAHYAARARGGVGCVVVEATAVLPEGRLSRDQLGIWSDDHVPGLARLATAIHAGGAFALIQIQHAGAQAVYDEGRVSASACELRPGKPARELTAAQAERIADAFERAALRARAAGFDGVELHGAHGYLLNQFTAPSVNHRTDAWGLPPAFPARIARGVHAAWPDAVIGYRFGMQRPTEDSVHTAQALEAAGVDVLSVSTGIGDYHRATPDDDWIYSDLALLATIVKIYVHIPVIGVGGFREPDTANAYVASGFADLVAVGRALLVDPDWAAKAQTGADITACLDCAKCRWFIGGDKCPALRRA